MITHVIFDLDDCLYNATWLANKSRLGGLKMMREKGLNIINMDKAIKTLNQVVEEFGSNSSNHFDIFLQRIKDNPDIIKDPNFSISKYVAAGVIGYHKIKVRHLKAYKDVKTSLETLKKEGYILGLISDGIAVKQYEKLLRMNITEYFKPEYIFMTDEVGIKKPNPELFKFCIEKMKISPRKTIYIGDRLDRDIEPALSIGMNTVLIHRGGKYDPNIHKDRIIPGVKPDYEVHSLSELVIILSRLKKSQSLNQNELQMNS